MLFEEFFKKKKIDLDILQKGEPELFSEFKEHYAQMGEKSFDHTKKFWFNKLRRQYPLPPEVKTEKIHAENPIAEQTIADTLTEPTPNAEPAKLGFRPKFKAGAISAAKPAESTPAPQALEDLAKQEPIEGSQPPAAEPAKMGFKPRFKAGVTKPAEETAPATSSEITSNTDMPQTEQSEPQSAKLGFKPRFKAGVTKPAEETTPTPPPEITDDTEAPQTEQSASQPAKLGFKPRFKAGVTGKSAEESTTPVEPSAESNSAVEGTTPASENTSAEAGASAPAGTPPKLGFKPRFKAGVTTSKPTEEKPVDGAPATPSANAEAEPAQDAANESAEQSAVPKLGFKPRFKAGVTTTKPAEEKPAEPASENNEVKSEALTEAPLSEGEKEEVPAAPKLGFKPRFKAGVTTTKPAEEEALKTPASEIKAEEPSKTAEEEKPVQPEAPAAKQPYKPRFNPNMMKPKPPAEGESE